jgi:hypothetical protein
MILRMPKGNVHDEDFVIGEENVFLQNDSRQWDNDDDDDDDDGYYNGHHPLPLTFSHNNGQRRFHNIDVVVTKRQRINEYDNNYVNYDDQDDHDDHDDDSVEEEMSLLARAPAFASQSTVNYPSIVSWNNQDWPVIVPDFVPSMNEVLSRFRGMTSFDMSHDQHRRLHNIVHSFVQKEFERRHEWVFTIQLAGVRDRIVYIIVYSNNTFKIGFSMNGGSRIRQQLTNKVTGELSTSCYGYTMMTQYQASLIIDASDVAAIKSLELPTLAVHPEWDDWQTQSITLYLAELFLSASLHGCTTGTAIERFTYLPSQKVRDTVHAIQNVPHNLVEAARDFLKETPDNSVHLLLTWVTFLSQLHGKAVNSEFLRHILRPQPKGGGFVKLYQLSLVLQTKIKGYRNSVTKSPSTKTPDDVLAKLKPLLEGKTIDTLDREAIRQALRPVQDDEYSVYQYPSEDELGGKAFSLFGKILEDSATNDSVYMERGTFQAIQKNNRSWVEANLDEENAIHVLPDKHLSFLRHKDTGTRIHVSSSLFTMYAQNTHEDHIFQAAKTFLLYLDLMVLAGNVDNSVALQQKAIVQAYLMNLEFGRANDSDDYEELHMNMRAARRRACPQGYFWGSPQNTQSVSRRLKVHYCVALYFYEGLGEDAFRLLLIANGCLYKGPHDRGYQQYTPIIGICEGLPATPNLEARPCTRHENTYTCCVKANSTNHIFDGMFVCNRCHGAIQPWEFDMLHHMQMTGEDLLPEQRQRLFYLTQKKNERAAYQQIRERQARGEPLFDESDEEVSEKLGEVEGENAKNAKNAEDVEDVEDDEDETYVPPSNVARFNDTDNDSDESVSDESVSGDDENRRSAIWERKFRLYEQFVKEKGHSDPQKGRIPKKYHELRDWATYNRNRKNRFKKHRIVRLDRLNFPWERKRTDWDKDHMIELLGELYAKYKRERSSPEEPFIVVQAYKASNGFPVGQWYENQKRKEFRGLTQDQRNRLGTLLEWEI